MGLRNFRESGISETSKTGNVSEELYDKSER
jgi:hypothetical protein